MANYDVILYATRILDKDRVDQSGGDNVDVTDWIKTAEFIIATALHTASKGVRAASFKLRWRNVSEAGSFADVGSSGEIHFTTADTVLSDGNAVVVGERRCSSYGDTWQDGLESENDNIAPDSGTFTLAEDYETEFQWALDCSSAQDGDEYEFELYDVTNGLSIGTCGATLTIVGAVPVSFDKNAEVRFKDSKYSDKNSEVRFKDTNSFDLNADNRFKDIFSYDKNAEVCFKGPVYNDLNAEVCFFGQVYNDLNSEVMFATAGATYSFDLNADNRFKGPVYNDLNAEVRFKDTFNYDRNADNRFKGSKYSDLDAEVRFKGPRNIDLNADNRFLIHAYIDLNSEVKFSAGAVSNYIDLNAAVRFAKINSFSLNSDVKFIYGSIIDLQKITITISKHNEIIMIAEKSSNINIELEKHNEIIMITEKEGIER